MSKLIIYYVDGSQTENEVPKENIVALMNLVSKDGFERPLDFEDGTTRLLVNSKQITRMRMSE